MRNLVHDGGALESEQPTSWGQQWQRPSGQLIQRRDGPGSDGLDGQLSDEVLRPRADDPGVPQPEIGDDLVQKAAATQQRLHQRHPQVWSSHRQHDSGQPGTGSHIGDRLALGKSLVHDCAVQHVTLPQARHLARTDQTALDPRTSQERDIPLSQRKSSTEDGLRLRRRIRRNAARFT
jgi:hypothetical protein